MMQYPHSAWRACALEIKNEGGDGADPVQAIEALSAAVTTKLTELGAELKKIDAKVDSEVAKLKRPGTETKTQDQELEAKAFQGYVRRGRESLSPEEIKSLRVGDDTAGGYLAPSEMDKELLRNIVEFSPIRQAARVGNTSAGEVTIPKRTGRPTGYWVNETETRTSTEPTYGQATIPIGEIAAYIDVSNKLLEDSSFNIESELAFDLAEEFGRLEGEAFVEGDGIKKPVGIMSNADINNTVNGHASTLQSDAFITLMYALPAFYRNRGVWVMNGGTLAAVRKLKDGQNNYLWQPSFQAGQPETFLSRPVIEAVDMPDIAANAFPVIFGDFMTGFRIYDRIALAILRDPYSQATSGLTRFHARRRVGAGVVKSEAFRKLKMST